VLDPDLRPEQQPSLDNAEDEQKKDRSGQSEFKRCRTAFVVHQF